MVGTDALWAPWGAWPGRRRGKSLCLACSLSATATRTSTRTMASFSAVPAGMTRTKLLALAELVAPGLAGSSAAGLVTRPEVGEVA
jgi:hypothetical protein